ncbi:MAG TPA: hypothetical protein VH475_27720 [Tepidisphaeraceae bacterium]|jgi:hypothetical protein
MKWAILSFLTLLLASCQSEKLDPTLEGFFPEDTGETRKPVQFAEIQAASGARLDATLSKQHFDGPRLNSLGEDKLSLMLKDDDADEPMRVYLNLDEKDAASKPRQTAVVTYLKDAGLAERQIEIVYGRNPDNWSRSSTHLSKLSKTETGTQTDAKPGGEDPQAGGANGGNGNGNGGGGNGGGGLTGTEGSLFK